MQRKIIYILEKFILNYDTVFNFFLAHYMSETSNYVNLFIHYNYVKLYCAYKICLHLTNTNTIHKYNRT